MTTSDNNNGCDSSCLTCSSPDDPTKCLTCPDKSNNTNYILQPAKNCSQVLQSCSLNCTAKCQDKSCNCLLDNYEECADCIDMLHGQCVAECPKNMDKDDTFFPDEQTVCHICEDNFLGYCFQRYMVQILVIPIAIFIVLLAIVIFVIVCMCRMRHLEKGCFAKRETGNAYRRSQIHQPVARVSQLVFCGMTPGGGVTQVYKLYGDVPPTRVVFSQEIFRYGSTFLRKNP